MIYCPFDQWRKCWRGECATGCEKLISLDRAAQASRAEKEQPTPRTDAAVFPSAAMSASDRWAHLVSVSRQLERELAHAREEWNKYMQLSCQQAGDLERAAQSARAAIIEECADVAANMMEGTVGKDSKYGECRFVVSDALFHCAQSIRALDGGAKREGQGG